VRVAVAQQFRSGWTSAKDLRVGDALIDLAGNPVAVMDIRSELAVTAIYNVELFGTFTYFASGVWVHNKSCPIWRDIHRGRDGGPPHVAQGRSTMDALLASGIPPENIRWNQALVSPDGRYWRELRPDIQYIGDDGRVYIIEIVDTHPPGPSRASDIQSRLGASFGGYEEQYVPRP